jgi:amino acid adenylation domain-containing protein
MKSAEYLSSLLDQGIRVWMEGEQLRFRAPTGVVTPEIKAELARRKAELIVLLTTTRASDTAIIDRASRDGDIPLSFAQERLWFMEQLRPGTGAYNIPGVVRLRGDLDLELLEKCVNEVIRRHEILRTTFEQRGQKPVQVIHPFCHRALEIIDFESSADADRERKLQERIREEAVRPFDLERGPMSRFQVMRVASNDFAIVYTLHHIVSDGWSMSILIREISILYTALKQGAPFPRSELPLQYADFSVWQRSQKQAEEELLYWKKQLADFSPLELRLDFPRPAAQTFRGKLERLEIDPKTTRVLNQLSRQEGATLFMTLLACFQTLLHRYTGQTDIVCGTPIATRPHKDLEQLIGFFVNTLVLRASWSGHPTFLELLRQVRETSLAAFQYQNIPFERLVEELKVERDLSRHPIVQTIFVLQNVPEAGQGISGLELVPMENEDCYTRGDLEVNVMEIQDRLAVVFMYNPDLFRQSTIRRMIRHFCLLASSIADNPAQRLGQVGLLSAEEREQQLAMWNQSAPVGAPVRLVHEAVEMQAARRSDAMAVVFGNDRITYGELNRRANALACRLKESGVGPEVMVGLYIDRSIELIVGILGILKAGAAYVPMDVNYPADRLTYMLYDAGVSVLVTTRAMEDRLPVGAPITLFLDETGGPGDENPNVKVTPQNLAYVIYTSGSTGKPKGTMLEHRGLWNLVEAQMEAFEIREGTRVLQFASIGFDASVSEIFTALAAGGELHLIERQKMLPGGGLEIELRKVEVVTLPPSVLALLDETDLGCLRTVVSAGEDCRGQVARKWASRRRFINAYGPTETTVCASMKMLAPAEAGNPSIGRPMRNVRLFILDEQMELLPVGAEGELFIGGIGVGRGYLNRQDLTAERFLPDPFSHSPGERLYRSGDLVRYRENGDIDYLGRRDRQIKLRGCRIETGEIEEVLLGCDLVQEAVVVAQEDAGGEQQLVAYLVPRTNDSAREAGEAEEKKRVESWKSLYDNTVGQGEAPPDPLFNITGWSSSYTGKGFPPEEMRRWADTTVERISALRPRRILEIGCGTGLLLFPLIKNCERYVATDFSGSALAYVEKQLERHFSSERARVDLHQIDAGEIGALPENNFDAVIINSVAQYFPGADFLQRVLAEGLKKLAPGGFVFVGDVRSCELLKAFHLSVQLHKASAQETCARLFNEVEARVGGELEMAVSPAFFANLQLLFPQISHLEIHLKRGPYFNELTRFRYDAVLYAGTQFYDALAAPAVDWGTAGLDSPEGVRTYLQSHQPAALWVRGIPNRSVAGEIKCLSYLERDGQDISVAQLRQATASEPAWDAEEFWRITGDLPYRTHVTFNGDLKSGAFDVLFCKKDVAPETVSLRYAPLFQETEAASPAHYTNDPMKGRRNERIVAGVRESLKQKLPAFMLPSLFLALERIPLNEHGKVDIEALPKPQDRVVGSHAFVEPQTPAELQLAGIWSDVLGVSRIGREENFFEIGGHSLLATQVVTRIRQAFGRDLPLKVLFENPTLAALAMQIETTESTAMTEEKIPRVARDRDLPLSFAQERMWFLYQLDPASTAYNISGEVRLKGGLNVTALESSLRELCRRHEILRTTFSVKEGRPIQMIHADGTIGLQITNLDRFSDAARIEELRLYLRKEHNQPFDLKNGPLIRTHLFRLGDADHVLTYSLHHIIADGWSRAILHREISSLYRQAIGEAAGPLAELPIQYADFATWQRESLGHEAVERQINFWKCELQDALVPAELPADRPRRTSSGRGAVMGLEIPQATSAAFKALTQSTNTTLYMATLAALELLLYRYTGKEFFIGSPIANRRNVEVEGLIGFFANTLVMRVELRDNPTVRTLLQRARETTLAGYACQDVPFGWVVEAVLPGRDETRNPLFQVMLVVQNSPLSSLVLPGLTPEPLLLPAGEQEAASKFDLSLQVEEAGGRLLAGWEYDCDLFDAATIQQMGKHLQCLLGEMAANPDRRILDLALPVEMKLPVSERIQNDCGSLCLHDAFTRLAKARRGRVAIFAAERNWRYEEVEESACRLAGELRRAGVRAKTAVAILGGEPVGSIVSILGVLKAGGVFMLVEPGTEEFVLSEIKKRNALAIMTGGMEALPPGWEEITSLKWNGEILSQNPGIRCQTDEKTNAKDPACVFAGFISQDYCRWESLTHEAVLRLLQVGDARLSQATGTWGVVSAPGTAAWMFEVWLPLLAGGCICCHQTPADSWAHWIEDNGITCLVLNPSNAMTFAALTLPFDHWNTIVFWDCSWPEKCEMGGGTSIARRLYLQAEITPGGFSVLSDIPAAIFPGRIRLPLVRAGSSFYVLDSAGRLAPPLVWGKLFHPGTDVPEAGRNAIPAAMISEDVDISSRLHDMGLPARRLTSGEIEIKTDSPHCAWIVNNRVNLDELAGVVGKKLGARECYLLHRVSQGGVGQLVAFLSQMSALDPAQARAALQGHIPEQWIAAAFIPVNAIPLLANGEPDESALLEIETIDEDVIQQWEQTLEHYLEKLPQPQAGKESQSLPKAARAVVMLESRSRVEDPIHLWDMFADRSDCSFSFPVDEIVSHRPILGGELPPKKAAWVDGGELVIPETAARTMTGALLKAARTESGIIYQSHDTAEFHPYAELLNSASRILRGLRSAGLRPGDSVVLQVEALKDHLATFWACVLGGIFPVTVAIPPSYEDKNAVVGKLCNTLALLDFPPVLTNKHLLERLVRIKAFLGNKALRTVCVDEFKGLEPDSDFHPAQPEDVLFLQLSSGSTGVPKCIQITHRGVIAHIHGSTELNGYKSSDVSLNWLPFDHVVPILTYHLRDVYLGCREVQMKPDMVLRNPLKWLDAIEKHRVTHTWSPNFGYKLVADAKNQAEGRTWDLSSIRAFMNAGEQVTLPVVREFLKFVSPFGVTADRLQMSFGMAEACTCMTYQNNFDENTGAHFILKNSLGDVLRRVDRESGETTAFVDLGVTIRGMEIRIADDKNKVVNEGVIGRLQLRGVSVTPGYLHNPAANQEAFVGDGWFNTGDRGFLWNGRLVITGREKEMIIVRGANYYCYEIEDVVNGIPGVKPTFSAAVGIEDSAAGTEGLAIFFVALEGYGAVTAIVQAIRAEVTAKLGLAPAMVVPLRLEDFPKTTSGKIQRSQLKAKLLSREFDDILKQLDRVLGGRNVLPAWFFSKTWKRKEKRWAPPAVPQKCLIFAGQEEFTQWLVPVLEKCGISCVIVKQGQQFSFLAERRYAVSGEIGAMRQLFETLEAAEWRPDCILHLLTCHEARQVNSAEDIRRDQQDGMFHILSLIKAFPEAWQQTSRKFYLISSLLQNVIGRERSQYQHSALIGLLKTLSTEAPWLHCSHLDLEKAGEEAAHVILREISSPDNDQEIAFRSGQRWVPALEKVEMLKQKEKPLPIRRGGFYLVTGGLGGVGNHVCEYLLKHHGARLLIVGRTNLAEEAEPLRVDEKLEERRQALARLSSLSKDVLYRAVDISDLAALKTAVRQVETQWECRLAGIFHLAGVGDLPEQWRNINKHAIVSESKENFEAMFAAKVYGTWNLAQLIQTDPDALFIAFSTVNSIFGGSGFSAYSAANSFLDSYCDSHRRTHRHTYSFNWTMWDDLGMSRGNPEFARQAARQRGFHVLSAEQGIHSLVASLSRRVPRLIVGLDVSNSFMSNRISGLPERLDGLVAYTVTGTPNAPHPKDFQLRDRFGVPSRCKIKSIDRMPLTESGDIDYARLRVGSRDPGGENGSFEERSPVELKLGKIWESVLRVRSVDLHDNFFNLGGHSLLVTQVLARIQEAFGVEMGLHVLFQSPTVRALAKAIEEKLSNPAQTGSPIEKANADMDEEKGVDVATLSDAEVDMLLEKLEREGGK